MLLTRLPDVQCGVLFARVDATLTLAAFVLRELDEVLQRCVVR
jgi:hypothetical protein